MNSNYQWQQQQANERVQARMREAAAHRLVQEKGPQRPSFLAHLWNKVSAAIQSIAHLQGREIKRTDRMGLADEASEAA